MTDPQGDDAFARLLKQQSSASTRERLHNLRHEFGLPGDDPVWALLAVLEDYCRALLERQPARGDETAASLRLAQPASSSLGFATGAALSTALMSLSFYMGFRAATVHGPPWLLSNCDGERSWPEILLALPAGWMMFVQVLPLLAYVMRCGWRVRHRDAAVSWTLIVAAAGAAITIVASLMLLLK